MYNSSLVWITFGARSGWPCLAGTWPQHPPKSELQQHPCFWKIIPWAGVWWWKREQSGKSILPPWGPTFNQDSERDRKIHGWNDDRGEERGKERCVTEKWLHRFVIGGPCALVRQVGGERDYMSPALLPYNVMKLGWALNYTGTRRQLERRGTFPVHWIFGYIFT